MSALGERFEQPSERLGTRQAVAVALFGLPGAGKTTSGRCFLESFSRSGFTCTNVKIAEPLYELQAHVYEISGHPLVSHYAQDGPLLQDLGLHVRRIDAHALLRHFTRRLETWLASVDEPCACICDDVRAPDAEHLRSLGFRFVEVTAPDHVRAARRAQRGDRARAADEHQLEARPAIEADLSIDNSGTLDQLRTNVDAYAAELISWS